jgi:microcystin-dependent protein
MSSLGKQLAYGLFEKQKIVPDGTSSVYTLNFKVSQSSSLLVVKNGLVLEGGAGGDYNVTGNNQGQIFFNDVPLITDDIFIIFLGRELAVAKTIGSEPVYHTDTGDGFTTSFTLPLGPILPDALIVFVDKSFQRLNEDFVVVGSNVNFTVAPSNGALLDFYIHGVERNDSISFRGWSIDSTDSFIPQAPNQNIGSVTNPIGNIFVGNNVTVGGNLTVEGTTVTLNTENLLIEDNKITLNSNFTTGVPVLNVGIEGKRGDEEDAVLRWNETLSRWEGGTRDDIQKILRDEDIPPVTPASPTGAIIMFGGSSAPSGWLLCDGQSVPVASFTDLHSVIGYAYGGAGPDFNVPDLRQKFPLGKSDSGTGSVLGETGGTIDHDHDVPPHYHGMGLGSDLEILSSGSHSHTIDHGHTASSNTVADHAHTINHGHTASSNTVADHAHTINHGHTASSNTVADHVHPNSSWPYVSFQNNVDVGTGVWCLGKQGGGIITGSDLINTELAGSHSHTITVVSHTGSSGNAGSHSHTITVNNHTGNSGNAGSHSHTITVDSHSGSSGSSSHSHDSSDITGNIGLVTGGEDGNAIMNTSQNNPPYVVVNYIIKT